MSDQTAVALPPRTPLRFWDAFLPIAAVVAAWLTWFGAAHAVAYAIHQGPNWPAYAAWRISIPGFLTYGFYIYTVAVIVLWLLCRARGPATFTGYFGKPRIVRILLGVLIGIVVAFVMMAILGALVRIGLITPHPPTPAIWALAHPHNALEAILLFALMAGFAPVVEEVYFRGVLLSWLRSWMWPPLAVLLDAAIFALLHGRFITHPGTEGWAATVIVGAMGLLNAVVYLRTKNLWMPFVIHAIYNGVLLGSVLLAVHITTSRAI